MNEQDREAPTTDDADNPAPTRAPLIGRPIYYGWWIVLAGAGILMLTAYAHTNLANFVFEPPRNDGISDTLPRAIGTAASLLLLLPFRPLVGHFVDRRGPLVPVTAALLIGGFTYIVLAFIGPSWPSYNSAILVGGVVAVTAHIALLTTVANLFSRHLGVAFALAMVGVSAAALLPSIFIGGMLFIAGFVAIYEYGPIHIAIVLFTGGTLCIAGLAFVYVLRRWPLDSSRRWNEEIPALDAPASATNELSDADATVEPAPLRLREILASRSFFLYVAAIALQSSIHWPLFVTVDSGWVNVSAALFSAIFVVPVLFVSGALSDRFNRKRVVMAILFLQLMVTLPLLSGLSGSTAVAIVFLGATGGGAGSPAVLALQWDYFGRRHFGVLFGIQSSVVALVSVIGPVLAGFVFDVFGEGPRFVFLWVILPLAIALVLILLMKRPQPGVPNPPTAKAEPQVA